MSLNSEPKGSLVDNSFSSMETESDYDPDGVAYAAGEFEECLRRIENSIARGDCLLERSKIYLKFLKHLHQYMLLPPGEFNELDQAAGELLASTFPSEAGLLCTPALGFTPLCTPDDDLLKFKAAEKRLLEEFHVNIHVHKIHACYLPEDWTNDSDQ